MPCAQRVRCSCDELPLSNFSSEDPDRLLYLGRAFGIYHPPPVVDPPVTPTGCTSFSNSLVDQADGDWCALFSLSACEISSNLKDPCWTCRKKKTGSSGWGLSVVCLDKDRNVIPCPDPCCDDKLPADCCCTEDNSNPDPPDGEDGDGGKPKPPVPPPSPPPFPPTGFGNDEQKCSRDCPGGGTMTETIPANSFMALSKAQANAMAQSACQQKLASRKICTDNSFGGGNPCKVFCQDTPVDLQLEATADNGGDLTYEITGDGNLPTGLAMDSSGHITGTPSKVSTGDAPFNVTVTDSEGNSVTRQYCIRIMGISPDTLSDGDLCLPYSASVSASGGYEPYTYSVEDGNLPDGLSIDSHTGVISGTPTSIGEYNFTIVATDHLGNACGKQYALMINGLANEEVTVRCPTDGSKSYTVDAGTYSACGPYAGYTQAQLNSIASVDAFNALQSQCPCASSLNSSPGQTHTLDTDCGFNMYIEKVDDPLTGWNTSFAVAPFSNLNLFSIVNTSQGNPWWNCHGSPFQKPWDGTYMCYSGFNSSGVFLFSMSFLSCP